MRDLTELAADLQRWRINLHVLLHQGIDTTTSTGRFTFHVLGALDELTADLVKG